MSIVNVGDTDGLREALGVRPSVTMPLLPFRQALLAVKPHAAGTKGLPEFQTVRILPGARHCHLVATDQYTVALAAVGTADLAMTELDPIDLHVDDVAKVLAVFKMPADKELWPGCTIRLETHDGEVSFIDAGGLFDGQELTVPMRTQSKYPDLPTLLARHLIKARALAYPPESDRGLPASAVVKLQAAVKTFDEPVWLQPTSADPKASFLALVGETFLALIHPATPPDVDDDDPAADWRPDRWRAAWAEHLPRTDS